MHWIILCTFVYKKNIWIIFENIMPKYSLKSGKDILEIEHTEAESFEDFQAKVFTLTDIPPKNLKVLFKGKMIKVFFQ